MVSYIVHGMMTTTSSYIYLNGVQLNNTPGSYTSNNLKFTSFTDFLLDEVKVYNRVLNETELKQLAGKLFLDLSGNRLNGVPWVMDFLWSVQLLMME